MSTPSSSHENSTAEKPKEVGRLVWVELAKLSLRSFFNRREIEWKTAFGLWTAIGLWTYFAVTNAKQLQDLNVGYFGILLIVFWAILLFAWQLPIRRSFEEDKSWLLYYKARAAGKLVDEPGNAPFWTGLANSRHWPWTLTQMGTTAVFFFLSWMVTSSAISNAK